MFLFVVKCVYFEQIAMIDIAHLCKPFVSMCCKSISEWNKEDTVRRQQKEYPHFKIHRFSVFVLFSLFSFFVFFFQSTIYCQQHIITAFICTLYCNSILKHFIHKHASTCGLWIIRKTESQKFSSIAIAQVHEQNNAIVKCVEAILL